MWDILAEDPSDHFGSSCKIWVEDPPKMDGEANEQQPKQERMRTRWTPELDKIFADIVVEQIRLGNRPNNVFDKFAWKQIREGFNTQTNLNFNNNQLRKHLDVLRTRYQNLQQPSLNQNDPIQDTSFMGFDMWEDIGVESNKIEPAKTKECPIYEQLCTIFADSGVDGKYAQSSHYEELHISSGIDPITSEGVTVNPCPQTPLSSNFEQGNGSLLENTIKNTAADKKRKRPSEEEGPTSEQGNTNQKLNDIMAETLLDMIRSSKMRTMAKAQIDERFTISNCVKVLDEIEGVEDSLYYAALDLFENPNFREMFVSLKDNNVRLTWLQVKCGSSSRPV